MHWSPTPELIGPQAIDLPHTQGIGEGGTPVSRHPQRETEERCPEALVRVS